MKILKLKIGGKMLTNAEEKTWGQGTVGCVLWECEFCFLLLTASRVRTAMWFNFIKGRKKNTDVTANTRVFASKTLVLIIGLGGGVHGPDQIRISIERPYPGPSDSRFAC